MLLLLNDYYPDDVLDERKLEHAVEFDLIVLQHVLSTTIINVFVQRIKEKILRTAPCCTVYCSPAQQMDSYK